MFSFIICGFLARLNLRLFVLRNRLRGLAEINSALEFLLSSDGLVLLGGFLTKATGLCLLRDEHGGHAEGTPAETGEAMPT